MKNTWIPKILLLTSLGSGIFISQVPNNMFSRYIINNKITAETVNTDSLTGNQHTPFYHLETAQGWSNDVQSIVYNSQKEGWDVYFLHSEDGATNPFGSKGQNWEHVFTKDFVNYSSQNNAIPAQGVSENPDSWKSAWTGSVVENHGEIKGVPKGAKVAYFSGLNKKDGSQNIYASWSADNGNTFNHPLNNGSPVLSYNQSGASGDPQQERDSFVTHDSNGKLLMYTAEGNKLGVYKSTDGINWEKADSNGASKVEPQTFFNGKQWSDSQNSPIECPQLITLKVDRSDTTKQVLFFGCKDPQNNETTGTYYVVGHLNQNDLFVPETKVKRFDNGSDYYGSNIQTSDLNEPLDSDISLGWIGNWNYTSQGVHDGQNRNENYAGRLGSYSLPRTFLLNKDLTLKEDFFDTGLNNKGVSFDSANLLSEYPTINGRQSDNASPDVVGKDCGNNVYKVFSKQTPVDAKFQIDFLPEKPIKNNRIYIDIVQGKDHILLNYDPSNGKYQVSGNSSELNNDMSGNKASDYYSKTYTYDDGEINNDSGDILIYTDKDSEEIKMPNGSMYTIARFGMDNKQTINVYMQDATSDNSRVLKYEEVDYTKLSNNDTSSKKSNVINSSKENKSNVLSNKNANADSNNKKESSTSSKHTLAESSNSNNITVNSSQSLVNHSKGSQRSSVTINNKSNKKKNIDSINSADRSNISTEKDKIKNVSSSYETKTEQKSNSSSVEKLNDSSSLSNNTKNIIISDSKGKQIKSIPIKNNQNPNKILKNNLPKGITPDETKIIQRGNKAFVKLPQTGENRFSILSATIGLSLIGFASGIIFYLNKKHKNQ